MLSMAESRGVGGSDRSLGVLSPSSCSPRLSLAPGARLRAKASDPARSMALTRRACSFTCTSSGIYGSDSAAHPPTAPPNSRPHPPSPPWAAQQAAIAAKSQTTAAAAPSRHTAPTTAGASCCPFGRLGTSARGSFTALPSRLDMRGKVLVRQQPRAFCAGLMQLGPSWRPDRTQRHIALVVIVEHLLLLSRRQVERSALEILGGQTVERVILPLDR